MLQCKIFSGDDLHFPDQDFNEWASRKPGIELKTFQHSVLDDGNHYLCIVYDDMEYTDDKIDQGNKHIHKLLISIEDRILALRPKIIADAGGMLPFTLSINNFEIFSILEIDWDLDVIEYDSENQLFSSKYTKSKLNASSVIDAEGLDMLNQLLEHNKV